MVVALKLERIRRKIRFRENLLKAAGWNIIKTKCELKKTAIDNITFINSSAIPLVTFQKFTYIRLTYSRIQDSFRLCWIFVRKSAVRIKEQWTNLKTPQILVLTRPCAGEIDKTYKRGLKWKKRNVS